jgi:hypothetical protein
MDGPDKPGHDEEKKKKGRRFLRPFSLRFTWVARTPAGHEKL